MLSHLHMTDENTGWSIYHKKLLRSTDGGETWVDVTPLEVVVHEGNVFILNEKSTWIVESENENQWIVYYTNDGGETWNKSGNIMVGGSFAKLFFINEQVGWIMIRTQSGLGYSDVTILRTTDGGQEWEAVTSETIDDVTNMLPHSGNKTGIAYRDQDIGWITGMMTGGQIPWIYRTDDGGFTWNEQLLTLPKQDYQSLLTTEPLFFNGRQGILAVHSKYPDKNCTFFFTTNDGGQNWVRQSTLSYLSSIELQYDFVHLDIGWAFDRKRLYQTTNGAKDWRIEEGIPEKLVPNGEIQWIDFVNSKKGWMIIEKEQERFHLFRTNDGGETWIWLIPRFATK